MIVYPTNVYYLVVPNSAGYAVLMNVKDRETLHLPKNVARKDVPISPWVNQWNSETGDLCFLIRQLIQAPKVYVRRMLWHHYHLNGKH